MRKPRTGPSALLIEPTEGQNFWEVLSQIPYKDKAGVSSIKKTKSGGVLVVLSPKKTDKSISCKAVNGLLKEKALVSSLEVEKATKVITSSNSRGQKPSGFGRHLIWTLGLNV